MAATSGLVGRLTGRDDVHITLVNSQARFTERLRLHQSPPARRRPICRFPISSPEHGGDFVEGWVTGIDVDVEGHIVTVHNIANPDKLHTVADGVRRL